MTEPAPQNQDRPPSAWERLLGRMVAPVDIALLREATGNRPPAEPTKIADLAKAIPVVVDGLAPIDRAISSAGGVAAAEVDHTGMLRRRPGTWVAGEMLAWDAPTGGYLIQACLSTGRRAGTAAAGWQSS